MTRRAGRPVRAVVALRLSALLVSLLLGCQAPLLSELDEAQANDALAVLAAAGIDAERTRTGRRHGISVDRDDLPRAWQAIQTAAALRPAPAPPSPRRWVLSPTEARLVARENQARTLESLLRALPGVLEAHVSLSAGSAAVVIRHGAHSAPARADVEALVRDGAGLPAGTALSLALHPSAAAPSIAGAASEPEDQAGAPRRLVGALVAIFASAALSWMLRRRRLRRAGIGPP